MSSHLDREATFILFTDWTKSSNSYEFDDLVQFAVWQREKGEKSDKTHLQGFLQLKKKMKVSLIKRRYFCKVTHIEICKKVGASKAYCSKLKTRVEGPWHFGKESSVRFNIKSEVNTSDDIKSKMRSEINILDDLVQNGISELDIIKLEPLLAKKYRYELKLMIKDHQFKLKKKQSSVPIKQCNLFLFSGDAGTGKSTIVEYLCQLRNRKLYQYEGNWWFSYSGESTLFIDEFNSSTMPFTYLNKLVNRKEAYVPIKGSQLELEVDEIFIATNYTIDQLFTKRTMAAKSAFCRRLALHAHFTRVDDITTQIDFIKYNVMTYKKVAEGSIRYYREGETFEERQANAIETVKRVFLSDNVLSDLF